MTKETHLPDGVPADNGPSRTLGAEPSETTGTAHYEAPDMSTPTFAHSVRAKPAATFDSGPATARRPDLMSREHQNITLLIAVVTLAMAIGGILLLRSPKETMQPCSELPEWNQYNCRAD